MKLVYIASILLAALLLIGGYTQHGIPIEAPQVSVHGQVNYFVTPIGNGDCLSWDSACTFRTALSKCNGTKICEINVGAGLHDLNNGSDANGTTVSVDYVHVIGLSVDNNIGQSSQFINSYATAAYILRVTGSKFTIDGVTFDNSAQTDKNVIMLNMRGSYSTVSNCLFRQNVGDPGGTGILADNGAASMTISHSRFRNVIDRGLDINDFTRVYIEPHVKFIACGTGIYLSHANAAQILSNSTEFFCNTTALNLATGLANCHEFFHPIFVHNTTNFADVAAYGGTIWFEDVVESGVQRDVMPVDAAGVTVSKDANAYTWGAYNDIIAAGTFAKPVKLETIIFEDWNAAQKFRIELFYGSASPGTTSVGVYEAVLGGASASAHVSTQISIDVYIPAYATIGAKLMSSTNGADDVTVALGFELL